MGGRQKQCVRNLQHGGYGGKINLGHLTYTEIRFWGEKTLATPDGRYNGDYISQGLTPSRLKKIPFVTDVDAALKNLKKEEYGRSYFVYYLMPY